MDYVPVIHQQLVKWQLAGLQKSEQKLQGLFIPELGTGTDVTCAFYWSKQVTSSNTSSGGIGFHFLMGEAAK